MRNSLLGREGYKTALGAWGAILALVCWVSAPLHGSAAQRGRQSVFAAPASSARDHYTVPDSTLLKAGPADSGARAGDSPPGVRRDPFKLPPPPTDDLDGTMMPSSHRPPGPRGLIISELTLNGIVSENSGHDMLAVVTNNTGRAYFLHETEQLYDGSVTKITPQAIYFMETVRDRKGHENVQQVVKWLNPKPGDGQ